MLGRTVVTALHDLNLASAYADDGRVLTQGPVTEAAVALRRRGVTEPHSSAPVPAAAEVDPESRTGVA